MSTLRNEFATWLRNHRQQQQITQAQLADLLGVSRSTIAHWETARKSPTWETFATIAERLGKTPAEFAKEVFTTGSPDS